MRKPTAVALGTFDGLHAGHRRVITAAVAQAALEGTATGRPVPSVVSFWPHPREVLYGETGLRLDLPEEKLAVLDPLGIEQLVLLPFTEELASLNPDEFVERVLVRQLQARSVAVGENFRFGAKRAGDAHCLQHLGVKHGFQVAVVPTLSDGAGRVSSSRIRKALAEGRLAEVEALLGRPFRFVGTVRPGRGLGRQLGWPTANLELSGGKVLPMEGVYASLVWKGAEENGVSMAAVMNLGRQPTVDPAAPSSVEVHLLDREEALLGHRLLVQPIRRLRSQQRFASLQELSEQISRDAKEAKHHLGILLNGEE